MLFTVNLILHYLEGYAFVWSNAIFPDILIQNTVYVSPAHLSLDIVPVWSVVRENVVDI